MSDDPGIPEPRQPTPSAALDDSSESAETARRTGDGREARREARAAKKAAKQGANAAKKAAKRTDKAATDAGKREANAARKAAKQGAKAAKKAAKAAKKAARKADTTANEATGTTRKADERADKAAKHARQTTAATGVAQPVARALVDRASEAATVAGTMLAEVAGLVRRTAEPAAARIVERLAERPDAGAPATDPSPSANLPAPEPPPAIPAPSPAPPTVQAPAADPEPAGGSLATALEPDAEIGAAIDVGATSVHLLVAAVGGHRVEPLLDESVFLGLGDRVGTAGFLGTATREELANALTGYVDTARGLGAGRITVVGTDPLRSAADAAMLVAEVENRTGVAVHVLTHDEEGMLTLLGVSGGRPIGHDLLVVDIGGGSTEIVVVGDGRVHASGLSIGAAQLTRDLVRSDPPSASEVETMRAEARRRVADAPDAHPAELVAVGGTASNLLRVLPVTALDRILTRRRIAVALAMLAVESSEDAAVRHVVRPTRARILPAGALIVDAFLERYGAERIRVSEEGIREGAIVAAARAGDTWRDRLPALARGWS